MLPPRPRRKGRVPLPPTDTAKLLAGKARLFDHARDEAGGVLGRNGAPPDRVGQKPDLARQQKNYHLTMAVDWKRAHNSGRQ